MKSRTPAVLAALLTAGLLTAVKLKAPYEMLLADRFINGGGWIEIAILAAYSAIAFGAAGLGVSAFVSLRLGVMVHCTSICPLGLIGNVLGKVSPFRIRIGAACTECGRCASSCRYNALSVAHIAKRRPGHTCTLCGDCLQSCPHEALWYDFPGIKPETARMVFLVLIVSLHAVFMGVARI